MLARFFLPLTSSCSLVEIGGKITRKTGEEMSEYGKNKDGVIIRNSTWGASKYDMIIF
jgi:hypothetical protein